MILDQLVDLRGTLFQLVSLLPQEALSLELANVHMLLVWRLKFDKSLRAVLIVLQQYRELIHLVLEEPTAGRCEVLSHAVNRSHGQCQTLRLLDALDCPKALV